MKNPKRFYVYCYAEPGKDHPFYIGKGRKRRAFEHLSSRALEQHTHFHRKLRAMLRRGVEPRIEFLYVAITHDEAIELECVLIARWGRLDLGTGCLTNATDGGDGPVGQVVSAETRRKLSEASRGKKKSPEAVAKTAASQRGKKQPAEAIAKVVAARRGWRPSPESIANGAAARRGKKRLPEAVAKTAAAIRGKPRSAETRAKISAAKLGSRLTPEHRAKLSAAGRGRRRSPESVEKTAAANRRSVQSLNPETGEVTVYPSMTATQDAGFTLAGVCSCCRGERKTHRGLIWSYCADEYSRPNDRGASLRRLEEA